jgi:histidinol-phosphatase
MLLDELELLHRLLDDSDLISSRLFGSPELTVETKSDGSSLTNADIAIEASIVESIHNRFPEDGTRGEEFGCSEGSSGRYWVIDPIDGTANFVRGIEVYATMVALVDGRTRMLSGVSAPGLRNRWWATRGGGAWKDGRRIYTSRTQALSTAMVSYSSLRGLGRTVAAQLRTLDVEVPRIRAFGDFWQHMMVADGRLDAAFDGPGLGAWDVEPIKLIIEEAGGAVMDVKGGHDYHGCGFISHNGLVGRDILALQENHVAPAS